MKINRTVGRAPDRRKQVVGLLKSGMSQAEVARKLGTSLENISDMVKLIRERAEAAVRKNDVFFQAAKLSGDARADLRSIAEQQGLTANPVIRALLGEVDAVIRTRKGTISVPFDGGGQHSLGKHLIETGEAVTGGVTLAEVAEYLPKTHENGVRHFEKASKVGKKRRKVRRGGAGYATYRFKPEGSPYGFKLVTAVDAEGNETLVSFYSTRHGRETKRAA